MKGLKEILVLSGLGVIGYAFYRYYTKQINFLSDIQYQITGIKIITLTQDKISIDVTSKIFNASNVEATITEMYLDLLINGIRVGNVNESKNILINPMASSIVSFRFTFNPKLILSNLVSLVTLSIGSKDVTIDAKGYVKVKSSFIQTVVPFEYQNNLKNLLKN